MNQLQTQLDFEVIVLPLIYECEYHSRVADLIELQHRNEAQKHLFLRSRLGWTESDKRGPFVYELVL